MFTRIEKAFWGEIGKLYPEEIAAEMAKFLSRKSKASSVIIRVEMRNFRGNEKLIAAAIGPVSRIG